MRFCESPNDEDITRASKVGKYIEVSIYAWLDGVVVRASKIRALNKTLVSPRVLLRALIFLTYHLELPSGASDLGASDSTRQSTIIRDTNVFIVLYCTEASSRPKNNLKICLELNRRPPRWQ